MLIPIILGSDKTTVSVATGQNEYWPIYLSIGNIHNNVHRVHCNGIVLLGFLPIPKGRHHTLSSIVTMTQLFMRSRYKKGHEGWGIPPLPLSDIPFRNRTDATAPVLSDDQACGCQMS